MWEFWLVVTLVVIFFVWAGRHIGKRGRPTGPDKHVHTHWNIHGG